MSQSLSNILVHLVFTTKDRLNLIPPEIQPKLNAYMATVLNNLGSLAIIVATVRDHAHILFVLSKNLALCQVVEEVKKTSSKWVKTLSPELSKFQWQAGYGAFSVSQSRKEAVRNYIANQNQHHLRISFSDEYRRLLEKNQIPYDEKYVWS